MLSGQLNSIELYFDEIIGFEYAYVMWVFTLIQTKQIGCICVYKCADASRGQQTKTI